MEYYNFIVNAKKESHHCDIGITDLNLSMLMFVLQRFMEINFRFSWLFYAPYYQSIYTIKIISINLQRNHGIFFNLKKNHQFDLNQSFL